MTRSKYLDIIHTMCTIRTSSGELMLDPNRLWDIEYVEARVKLYIESANIVRSMMGMPPLS